MRGDMTKDGNGGADRRKHRRAALKLGARFLLANGAEHSGVVTDISLGGRTDFVVAWPVSTPTILAIARAVLRSVPIWVSWLRPLTGDTAFAALGLPRLRDPPAYARKGTP